MSDRLAPVLDAVVAKVTSRGFAVGGVMLPVLKRKATHRHRTLDGDRQITVAKSATPERTTRRRFGLWQTRYVIDVVVLSPHTGPEQDQDLYASIRDAILDDFKKGPVPGNHEAFDWDAAAADWLRPFGDGTEWDVQSLQVFATVAHS